MDPKRRIFCAGYAEFYKRRYRCNFRGGHGWMDLRQALMHSCNVYFYEIGREVGIGPIAEYARKMGLGRPSGIDLLGEESGLIPDEEWSRRVRKTPWYPGETISVSIGQGPLLVTPLQMAVQAGAVGTGRFVSPHLVHAIDGQPIERKADGTRLPLQTVTLDLLRRSLWGVVNQGGTGKLSRLKRHPEVEVAGKTGTVQVVKASAGVDSNSLPEDLRDHSWFVGYAPADQPVIAFAVFVEHGGHGGEQAAPIARQVLDTFFDARPASGVDLARR